MGSRVVVSRGGTARRGWRRLLTWQGAVALLAALVLAAFGIAYALIRVPSPNEVAQAETSIYYFSDGKTEMARQSNINRVSVPLSQVPDNLQHAVLAAEDRGFYENPGVSIMGLGRAVWAAVTGGPTQGGSTITQQYVKNYFLTHDQTLARKGRELIISIKVEQDMSKQQILENYLNTIYFGRGAYGIQAASQAYFGKDVDKLDLDQSVFLASILQAPGMYDPSVGAEQRTNVINRMKYVRDGMVSEGWLPEALASDVTLPEVNAPKPKVALSGPNGYVVALARDELINKVGLSEQDIERGGLRVVTTISRTSQQNAIEAVNNNRPTGGRADGIRVGLASIKPGDGAIIALYGGSDYAKNPWSSATQAQLQSGSTFKVFTLAAALEQGISTRQTYDGNSPQRFSNSDTKGGGSWEVSNFRDADYGYVSLRDALAKSVNTAFAEVNLEVGADKTKEMAAKLGIPENTPGLEANLSNVFGTASVRVIDMANAYATIAAQGIRSEPYVLKSVTATDERFPEYTGSPSTRRVKEADVAADTIEAMRRVVTQGTGTRAQNIGYPAAGKTGTTDENKAVWFDGFTPQAATAVALYMPDETGSPQPLQGIGGRSELTGGTYPLAIWTGFMRRYMEGQERISFPDRAGVGDSRARIWVNPEPKPEPQPSRTRRSEPSRSETSREPSSDGPSTWEPDDVPRDRGGDSSNSGDSGGSERTGRTGGGGNDSGGSNGGGDSGGDNNARGNNTGRSERSNAAGAPRDTGAPNRFSNAPVPQATTG